MIEPQASSAADPKPAAPARPRVMAVDDQADSLRLLQLRLEAGGMECLTFSDGVAALQALETQPVDVVILDVMMPRLDGYEVCRRIKANERTRDIPVIFLTSKLDAADKVQGLDVGGHDYLSKPVQQQELLARTRAALRVKQLQDQLKGQLQLQQQVHQLHHGMLGEHWQKTFGQLAASLAHEINNPLAAALGTVQLLKVTKDVSPDILQPLNIIDQSLQRAGQKLRSLLLIAQSSRMTQSVSLERLIQDLVTLLNFQVVMCKVTLKTEVSAAADWQGVPSELARALLYILNNAIEAATGRDKATVTVSLTTADGCHCLAISDNGPGIAPEIRARIFEPFFTTKTEKHHGIGLYLAEEIVKEFGGRIELLATTPPAPTTFVVRLPIKPVT